MTTPSALRTTSRGQPAGLATRLWKLEAALRCRSFRTRRYSSPVRLVKLTKAQGIARYARAKDPGPG
jgi:hypothetical protein